MKHVLRGMGAGSELGNDEQTNQQADQQSIAAGSIDGKLNSHACILFTKKPAVTINSLTLSSYSRSLASR
jgi:hypothetical protein